jgi:transposase-like protein
MAGRRRWTAEERRDVMATYGDSGPSLWAFARASGVPYSTLVHWKRHEVSSDVPRLAPVEIERADDAAVMEVVVRDVVVRVRESIDDAVLVRVVRALRAC